MSELDGKSLLPKTPHVHALTAGWGEVKVGLKWELPHCCLAFTVLGSVLWAANGELSLTCLLGYGPCVLKYQHTRQGLPACVIVAWQLHWLDLCQRDTT